MVRFSKMTLKAPEHRGMCSLPLLVLLVTAGGFPANTNAAESELLQKAQAACEQFGFKLGTDGYSACVQREVWNEKELVRMQQVAGVLAFVAAGR